MGHRGRKGVFFMPWQDICQLSCSVYTYTVSPNSMLYRQLKANQDTEVNYLQNENFVVSIYWK
jgi:hypothetical protein